jgi:drug/metabolite transporter (DMT)-like permease
MNEPILYALAAMACFGLSDFIYKQAAAAGIRASHFLMVQAWFFCPLIIVYALAAGRLVPVPSALWGFLAGLFAFIGLYYFVRSLSSGAVSTNASFFRMNFIVTVLLAATVLGEPLTQAKLLGLALAATAAWLLLGPGSGGADSEVQRRSLIHAAVATLTFGAVNFFHTVGLRHGAIPETLVVAQAASFMPLATATVYFANRSLHPPLATYRHGAAAAAVLLGATLFLMHALARGPATVLVPIAQMGFLIAALLGIFVLGERVTIRKAAGLAMALAALAVLAAS